MNRFVNLIRYATATPPGDVILNIKQTCFSIIRNGDMIGLANIVEHLRQRDHNPQIKFFIEAGAIHQTDYCRKFKAFLEINTNYFSTIPGRETCNAIAVSIWDYRIGVGDLVQMPNTRAKQKKICIFPVFDAPYNLYRNWSLAQTQMIIDRFSTNEYSNHQKYFCAITQPQLNYRDFLLSSDFMTNVEHIMTCDPYIGGDTGMTHFASILAPGPRVVYYGSSKSIRNTLPFHHPKAEMNYY
jgi:hypothetical protein